MDDPGFVGAVIGIILIIVVMALMFFTLMPWLWDAFLPWLSALSTIGLPIRTP